MKRFTSFVKFVLFMFGMMLAFSEGIDGEVGIINFAGLLIMFLISYKFFSMEGN